MRLHLCRCYVDDPLCTVDLELEVSMRGFYADVALKEMNSSSRSVYLDAVVNISMLDSLH